MIFKEYLVLQEVEIKDELHNFAINKSEALRDISFLNSEQKPEYNSKLSEIISEFDFILNNGSDPKKLHAIKTKLVGLRKEIKALNKPLQLFPKAGKTEKALTKSGIIGADGSVAKDENGNLIIPDKPKPKLDPVLARFNRIGNSQDKASKTQSVPVNIVKPKITPRDKLNNLLIQLDNPKIKIPVEIYTSAKEALTKAIASGNDEDISLATNLCNDAMDSAEEVVAEDESFPLDFGNVETQNIEDLDYSPPEIDKEESERYMYIPDIQDKRAQLVLDIKNGVLDSKDYPNIIKQFAKNVKLEKISDNKYKILNSGDPISIRFGTFKMTGKIWKSDSPDAIGINDFNKVIKYAAYEINRVYFEGKKNDHPSRTFNRLKKSGKFDEILNFSLKKFHFDLFDQEWINKIREKLYHVIIQEVLNIRKVKFNESLIKEKLLNLFNN